MLDINPLLLSDYYKNSHADLYDKNTEKIYATWTPRTSRLTVNGELVDKVVVFGFQGFIKDVLLERFDKSFFKATKKKAITDYLRIMKNTLGNEGLGKEKLEALYNLGYLPIRIDALEEGSLCPLRVPCMTIENTLPEFYWITNFLETILSTEVWKPITSATIALEYRKILEKWASKTCDNNAHVDFQAHDFSMRGMAGLDAAMTSGAGHLLSFSGTDTIPAICYLEHYYNANVEDELVGTSIPATEHSIMCCNSAFEEDGDKLKELEAFRRIITEVHPTGFVSIVSDTWNLWEVCTSILPKLKEDILNRENGRVVIRPDSGNPVDIICGERMSYFHPVHGELENNINLDQPYAMERTKGVIELLWDVFGGTTNEKGYKVLNSHIGAIYGDAITLERADEICKKLEEKGFASSNIVFGVGSFCVTPDTKILCSDLIWREAGSLNVGQGIICFDENPTFGNGASSSRKYKLGKITANNKAQKKCIKINCGDKGIKCSIDHPFLVYGSRQNRDDFYSDKPTIEESKEKNMPRGYGLIWKKANELTIGDKIAYFQEPWEQSNNNDIGWLRGIYDGEGSFGRGSKTLLTTSSYKINICQNEGIVLDKIFELLDNNGFDYYTNPTPSGCMRVVLKGGFLETLRFLGIVRPLRFMKKLNESLELLPDLKNNATYNYQEITSIEDINIQDVASITTSEGTFITEGFLSHNTYQMNTRDTFGQALKSTYAIKGGEEVFLFKDPITDDGVKKSQKGMVVVSKNYKDELEYTDGHDEQSRRELSNINLLKPLFLNGKLLRDASLSDIRNKIKKQIKDSNLIKF